MTTKLFDEFVKEQASAAKGAPIDWAKQLADWQQFLADFYKRVETFLEKYVTENKIELRYKKKTIHEESIGTYDVNALTVLLGNTVIRFDPVGTMLIGTKGRIDMTGPRGTVTFLLVDKDATAPRVTVEVRIAGTKPPTRPARKTDIEWTWKILTSRPSIKFENLEPTSFYDAMMKVVNG
jgi:ABC-type Fe3+/spermidine/putrescine transport system ATPase subunit